MELHDLKPRPGSKRPRKRVGRGIAAGQGKTAGRGTKGQGARAGSGGKVYHQGGNLPFFRRLPFKRGFTKPFRTEWEEVNVGQLRRFEAGEEITPEKLAQAGLIRDPESPVVLLAHGKLSVGLKIRVHRASAAAEKKVKDAGGDLTFLPLEPVEEDKVNIVQVADLTRFEADTRVTPEVMAEAGLLPDPKQPVSVHGRGELIAPLTVQAHHFSQEARASILRAGGAVELMEASA